MIEQSVNERAGVVARSGMHDHSRRLVYDYYVIVLVNHVERNIFGESIVFLGLGELDGYLITLAYFVIFSFFAVSDENVTVLDELCGTAARNIRRL